ncbi:hypothetical protein [Synechococcus sp. CCAP 1479/9]|uniref:hypothetical protein n=1 Tax=Synechococcus sp. CCAP 1479/9 TaxID=1221593 RepID=UPI001C2121A9|nr:hypothetical protein [Synechococcus sp. CCAP 1479/9]
MLIRPMARLGVALGVTVGVTAGVTGGLLTAPPVRAQSPVVNLVAKKVIERYQKSSCEQLWAARSERRGSQEQRVLDMLNDDPQLRQGFIDQVAGPVVNKLFVCGMIP